jgi:MFS family permease
VKQLTRYQFSVASFAMPHGMLEVLFPYLVVVYLVESPERVGVAQMVLMLPGLFFMLIGGVVADRVNKRTMLMALHLVNVIPVSGLVLAIWMGDLGYRGILIFALASGTAWAFVQPVQDAMLNQVSGGNLQRSITASILVMYGTNLAGIGVIGEGA